MEVVTKRHTRYYRLEDRIEHIYSVLEKLIDHQADIERKSGLQIKARPRRHLEGWEFRDLITDGDPFFPKVATLQTIGKGWVDFTRSIHAICLFGKGFGDMIEPKRSDPAQDICSRWHRLPLDRYYLAACVSDIKEIIDNDGDDTVNPIRICDGMLWHMKQTLFQACPCTTTKNDGSTKHKHKDKHHDPVQVLFPKGFTSLLKPKPGITLEERGAVIFGHNMNLHWHWADHGSPVKGDPPPLLHVSSSTAPTLADTNISFDTNTSIVDTNTSATTSRSDMGSSSTGKLSTAATSLGEVTSPPASESSSVGNLEDISCTEREQGEISKGSKRPLLDLGFGLAVASISKRVRSGRK